MGKILCFGELLLRIAASADGKWINEHSVPVYPAGSEANAAAALANWNVPVKYCTALPGNYVAHTMIQYLQQRNIDTSAIQLSGKRIGLYYLLQDADLKHESVIYDRDHSSFAAIETGMFDWEKIFDGVSWFHFSAICPALNENVAAVCKEALEAASRKNITVSIDLNYRSKLWQYGKEPIDIMPQFTDHCNVLMGNIWSANKLLGTPLNEELINRHTKETYLQHALQTATEIGKRFGKCKTIVNTFRFEKDKGIDYYATLYKGAKQFVSKQFSTNKIICKIGSGDCCMAGLIYGLYNDHQPQRIIDYAAAAAFGKLQEETDFTEQTIQQIESIINRYE